VCNTTTCACDPTGCTQDSDCTISQCCLGGECQDMYCGGGTWQCGLDTVCTLKSCGSCAAGTHCDNTHMCVADVDCDDDGDCQADECCVGTPGVCKPEDCTGLECGPDPECGHSCGTCTPPATCVNGHCQGTGTGALGDPCPFTGGVNDGASECNTGLTCLGLAPDAQLGTCTSSGTECTELLVEWNPDCINGVCGASFCSQPCGTNRSCPAGFSAQDVGDPAECWCLPEAAGAGNEGDPCEFVAQAYPNLNPVNEGTGMCRSDLHCVGLAPTGDSGTCPGGSASECSSVYESWNPDCVDSNCGASLCAPECGANRTCDEGWVAQDVGTTCLCLPTDVGTSQVDDPCPFSGGINAEFDSCAAGLACLGYLADGTSGTCPGGLDSECTDIPANLNPDCVGTNCGYSVCADECDANRNCDVGFTPTDVGTPPNTVCYCIPS
jgi:hypothetical protein